MDLPLRPASVLRTAAYGAMTVVVTLTLSGCSAGERDSGQPRGRVAATFMPFAPSSPEPADPTTRPTERDDPELREAVLAYSEGYLSGAAEEVYALMSRRCQGQSSLAEVADGVALAQRMYDMEPVRSLIAVIENDEAMVTYTYASMDLNQTREPWTRESGEWRNDDCW